MNIAGRLFKSIKVIQRVNPIIISYTHGTKNRNYERLSSILFAATLFSWNPFKSKTDDPEDQLVATIKRSILLVQNGEPKKAEQMLHLALRMAQDLKSRDGITFVYDVMANLAMDVQDYVKAEKLFVDVMKRIMGDGAAEDDNRVLHISSKIAYIAYMQENIEKAKQVNCEYQFLLFKIKLNHFRGLNGL